MSEGTFLVRWRGRQAGPYTRPVIEEKLRNKELSLLHEVFCGGRWILMKEFVAQERAAMVTSTEPMSIKMTEPSSLEHDNVLGLPAETPSVNMSGVTSAPSFPSMASAPMDVPVAQPAGVPDSPTVSIYSGLRVPTYFVLAILSSLFCCFPLGLVAIWFASQVEGKQNSGNIAGALEASTAAKNWCIVTVVFALTIWLLSGLSLLVQMLAFGRRTMF